MEGHGKPRNLYNFAAVSQGILQTGLWNLQNLLQKTVRPNNQQFLQF